MRTTLNLNNKIINEALLLTGEKTKTGLIHRAIEEMIRKENFTKLLKLGGKAKIKFDVAVSRGRK